MALAQTLLQPLDSQYREKRIIAHGNPQPTFVTGPLAHFDVSFAVRYHVTVHNKQPQAGPSALSINNTVHRARQKSDRCSPRTSMSLL